MDVTFQELEPYYSLDVTSPFDDSPNTSGIRREGENSDIETRVMVRSIPCPCPSGGETQMTVRSIPYPCPMEESDEHEPKDVDQEEENQTQGELRVYMRRKPNEGHMPCPGLLAAMRKIPLIAMVSHMTLLTLSHILTYHLCMEHLLHLWIRFLYPSVGRQPKKTQIGGPSCWRNLGPSIRMGHGSLCHYRQAKRQLGAKWIFRVK